ncbi:MAG: hypothetical protein AAGA06_08040 [Pseudomonadota bacterium]
MAGFLKSTVALASSLLRSALTEAPDLTRVDYAQRTIERGGGDPFRYRAPHAYRPTPKRPPRRMSSTLAPRLFKGHRP